MLDTSTTVVVGFAMWSWHPFWPDTCLLDVYCHSSFWGRAKGLLEALNLPTTNLYIAYADVTCEAKQKVLQAVGFKHSAILRKRVVRDWTRRSFQDVALFEK